MPGEPYVPAIAQVGSIMRARTKDKNGVEVGTFNADTRPTATAVTDIIESARQFVTAATGTTIPTGAEPQAKAVIALRAAMLIELSYWPEQVRSDKSPYTHYRDEYRLELKQLIEAISEAAAIGADGAPSGDARMPKYIMPEDTGGMVGWGTIW